jgi:hypothetical protein
MKIRISPFAVILGVCILSALVAGVYSYTQKERIRMAQSVGCEDFESVSTLLETKLGMGNKITVRNAPIRGEYGFFWRRDAKEPMVRYPAQKSQMVYVYDQSSDKTIRQVKEKILPAFNELGLVANTLSGVAYSEEATGFAKQAFAFSKGQYHYVIDLDGAYVEDIIHNADGSNQVLPLPENSTGISLTCGTEKEEYNQIYSSIISKGVYTPKDRIGIADQKDGVVYLSVGTVGGFGGHASFWLIKDSSVEQLVKGTQEAPECAIFEAKKVGLGMECYDLHADAPRTVSY